VLYAPLLQNSASLDSGGPTTGGLVPSWMSVDPHTSRIWFATWSCPAIERCDVLAAREQVAHEVEAEEAPPNAS
jgi:hypothetical protein